MELWLEECRQHEVQRKKENEQCEQDWQKESISLKPTKEVL